MKRISQAVGLALLALYMTASQDGTPVVTPVSFRHPEQGTLTLLGNPIEATTTDLADQARAWEQAVADFATQGVHFFFFPHVPLTECWKGENQYDLAPTETVIRRTLKSDPRRELICVCA